jgi:tRNA-specific 2-thiouridylase
MARKQQRVVVAMSGGVDSSLAAYRLVQEGYEVIGVTMQIWANQDPGHAERHPYGRCGVALMEDARRVAQRLGIPFFAINLEREFDQQVVDYFCSEYLRGRTPNPCIVCNEKLKLGRLWEKARSLDAQWIATGHYARVEYDENRGRYLLRRGVDTGKDQSYVLFSLSQDQLSRVRFPLGTLHKDRVRETARTLGLGVSDKADSQEICFVWGRDYRPFLQRWLGKSFESGPIVDREGRVLGSHPGISAFTVGQRRGLGISVGHPLYVLDIDRISNRVVVGPEKETFQDRCGASGVNWIAVESLTEPQTVEAKIRYNHPGAEAILDPVAADRVMVRFKTPQKALTPGQGVVFYQGDIVLGGGWIDKEVSV